jgi:hypothetical protein
MPELSGTILMNEERFQRVLRYRSCGDPGKTRTPNILIRSQVLYPVELRDRWRRYWPRISRLARELHDLDLRDNQVNTVHGGELGARH